MLIPFFVQNYLIDKIFQMSYINAVTNKLLIYVYEK